MSQEIQKQEKRSEARAHTSGQKIIFSFSFGGVSLSHYFVVERKRMPKEIQEKIRSLASPLPRAQLKVRKTSSLDLWPCRRLSFSLISELEKDGPEVVGSVVL